MIRTCPTSVADYITEHGKKSCRKLAGIFNRSKSSIHRRQQKIKSQAHIPGALFFESTDGQIWLKRLVVAAVFIFGIKSGVGSETLALFFSMIAIESFIAISPASLKRLEDRIDDVIIEYKSLQDDKVKEKAVELSITPGGDETFFEKFMMLVLRQKSFFPSRLVSKTFSCLFLCESPMNFCFFLVCSFIPGLSLYF